MPEMLCVFITCPSEGERKQRGSDVSELSTFPRFELSVPRQNCEREGRDSELAFPELVSLQHGLQRYIPGMRIVSLLPSATEILFALGLDGEIVGVSHECDFPPQAKTKPVVIHSRLPHDASPAEIDRLVSEDGH